MTNPQLEELAKQYSPSEPRDLFALARKRALQGEASLLALAALAADLTLDDILNLRATLAQDMFAADIAASGGGDGLEVLL